MPSSVLKQVIMLFLCLKFFNSFPFLDDIIRMPYGSKQELLRSGFCLLWALQPHPRTVPLPYCNCSILLYFSLCIMLFHGQWIFSCWFFFMDYLPFFWASSSENLLIIQQLTLVSYLGWSIPSSPQWQLHMNFPALLPILRHAFCNFSYFIHMYLFIGLFLLLVFQFFQKQQLVIFI